MLKRDYSSNLETASRHTSALVFEFGQAFVRVGIAGESTPRVVIPVIIISSHPQEEDEEAELIHSFWKSNVSILGNSNKQFCTSCTIVLDAKNHVGNDDDNNNTIPSSGRLLPWLSNLYTYHLFLKPKSRRVVVILPTSYPPTLQYQLQKYLLEDLEVPSVYFTHVFHTIPYAIGSRTGVIIDIGHEEARMAVYFDGIMSEDTLQIVPFGYANCIRILASQRDKTREQMMKDTRIHSLLDEETIQILYSEYLFNLHLHDSIMYAFLTMLSKCPIDLRRHVLESVAFVGGGITSLPNFEREFMKHLMDLYETSPSESTSSLDGSAPKLSSRYPYRVKDRKYARFDCLGISIMSWMNVIQLKFHPVSMAWVGGSIMASIKNDRMKWIQREASKIGY
jgi:actin-related protein